MNKRQAEAIARDIERHGLQVTGYRRYDYGRKGSSWAVDVVDKATGIPFTVYDTTDWRERQSQYGNVAATPGRPPLSPDGVRMTYHSIAMPDALWAWAERGDTRSANVRKAVDERRMLQDALDAGWNVTIKRDGSGYHVGVSKMRGDVLKHDGHTAATLSEALSAVLVGLDVERAEAQAEDLAPTYNGGRW